MVVKFDARKSAAVSEENLLEQRLTSPTALLILAATILGAFIYIAYLLRPEYRGDVLPYVMVLIAEIYLVTQGVLSFWTILSGKANPRGFEYHSAQDVLFGARLSKSISKYLHTHPIEKTRDLQMYVQSKPVKVSVFIPVYGEPVEEIRETAIAARDMYGRHETYILDDGESDAVRQMAAEVGVLYIRRPEHTHAKAGNVNYALRHTDDTFFVILDADFVAKPEFLYETIPFFEDETLAMVQTPQYYNNARNFVSKGAAYMQHLFYAMVMAGKNRFNAAFCVGTCVVFRRKAIESIGGIYDKSKSEDIWTSLKLHENKWRTVYINTVLAEGKTPETIKAYSKQQLRWATGSFEILLTRNPLFNKRLTIDQRVQYFMTTIFYFNGFAILTLLLLPALQIFFNISPVALNIPLWQWVLMYSGFYVMQLMLAIYIQGGLRLETIMISAISFPIYIKAFFIVFFRRDQTWDATNAKGNGAYDSPFNYVRMQCYVAIFLALTAAVGIWKAWVTEEFSIAILWSLANALVFLYFLVVARREATVLRAEAKAIREEAV